MVFSVKVSIPAPEPQEPWDWYWIAWGFSWQHMNPNQWTHQWCALTMDGQPGWADGMGGIADYGDYPLLNGGSYTASDGTVYTLAQ